MLSHGTHCTQDGSIRARFQCTYGKLNRRLPHATAAIIMTGPRDAMVHWQSVTDIHQTEASLSLTSSEENQTDSKAPRFRLSDLFPDEVKTSYSHRESTS